MGSRLRVVRSLIVGGFASIAVLGFGLPVAADAAAPMIVSPPGVMGTAQAGQTLTEKPAQWSGASPPYKIQWLDCDTSGCEYIAGANSSTYKIASRWVGDTIKVQETAMNSSGSTTAASPQTSTVTEAPPSNITPPSIFGSNVVGETLVDSHGTWDPAPSSFTYNWLDCSSDGTSCSPVAANGNGQTYTLTPADAGFTIEVQETASDSSGPAVTPATSSPTAVVGLESSSASLVVVPSHVVTNQAPTLIATITSSSASADPNGTVTFQDGQGPIAECAQLPVSALTQSATVRCQPPFSAASSPESLTVLFTPASSSGLAGSTSQAVSLPVNQDSTSTLLDVSNSVVGLHAPATYTASVVPGHAGPFLPTGSVEFLDGGKPIGACAAQPVTSSQGSASAQCTVRYVKTSSHSITARYLGDPSFSASGSSSERVSARTLPLHVLGTVTSKMLWTFQYTPTYTRVVNLLVHRVRAGTHVLLECRGQGCPFAHHSTVVKTTRMCSGTSRHRHCVTERFRNVNVVGPLRGHHLHIGSVLTVEFSRPQWIGKAYSFTVRSARGPSYRIRCLAPGSTRPGVGC